MRGLRAARSTSAADLGLDEVLNFSGFGGGGEGEEAGGGDGQPATT